MPYDVPRHCRFKKNAKDYIGNDLYVLYFIHKVVRLVKRS